jgi:hypothetical protein
LQNNLPLLKDIKATNAKMKKEKTEAKILNDLISTGYKKYMLNFSNVNAIKLLVSNNNG